jgi:hypothetical protein
LIVRRTVDREEIPVVDVDVFQVDPLGQQRRRAFRT